ncbi:4-alpha-glucanotransferase [Chryseobacterium lactis]|uniref:4-alpha-glucanotransferase n=1 Tax=Chryseobacterium lactis TaxID=1241981 RepID=A0A3G6RPV5_CHRLC|nr:4-alpha-glucanotransferase [Chryseobacterium lactis]AZA81924.1 4-alpha-glucanotransferase [Chryseobacterium lactis]AZB06922.1 4-alpha-glucanotransferase [Chryseobacterium lactis]PNW10973.1 4-alpha-glucanotransferase [Chryseobacterium lactis]
MKLYFNVEYIVKAGENLELVIGEEGSAVHVHTMFCAENGLWKCEVDYFSKSISYLYRVVDDKKNVVREEFVLHYLNFPHNYKEFIIFDEWNNKNFPENYLNNKILYNKLHGFIPEKSTVLKKHTHLFRIEAPIYNPDWRIVLFGSTPSLGGWSYDKAIHLFQTDFGIWEASVEIPENEIIQFKYCIYDTRENRVIDVETGENRFTVANPVADVLQIVSNHYFRFKGYQMYHDAGVAVPVFSLRSEDGFGVGEFADLKKLAEWAKETNLGIIQILPINDTTANYSWTDSYPYAAVSVYALHPQYISLERLDFSLPKELVNEYRVEKEDLNALALIDYEKMIAGKWRYLKATFNAEKESIYKDRGFKKFIKDNESWLVPYSAFCVLRDKYKTPNFNDWKTHKKYIAGKISQLFTTKSKDYDSCMVHAWVQYELHKQLKEAVDYTHSLGVSLKGDLPIGIYRYSVEAWTEPELFGMDFQAGAPPDQFTELGQNWEFPTYNWEAMKADDYKWWKNRFKALEQYFDAMRIDHILGFFRIWRMPISAVQGILGYFYPAVPIVLDEFKALQIPFTFERYCKPFINNQILSDMFGADRGKVLEFIDTNQDGTYSFKEEFDTQRKLVDFFKKNPRGSIEEQLISLCANVLFLTEERKGETGYHPRFNVYNTESFNYLSESEQKSIYELYHDYFFRRQDHLWLEKAMEKLPVILNATKMLICGEDLGMVPACVPVAMDELAIIALKVQRMPSENIPFYNPRNASYMNVITASSHDSSTLRQWWKEDPALTQRYFNQQLIQYGKAPQELTPYLAEIIMKQHLYNEAMLAIFPIQEFMATDAELTNKNIDDERINNPAVFPHYWRYRMHIRLEDLKEKQSFNEKIAYWVKDSRRM